MAPHRFLSVSALILASACSDREPPPGDPPPAVVTVGQAQGAAPAASSAAQGATSAAASSKPLPPAGKLAEMVVVGGHAQVFLGPVATKGTQIGYLKRGSHVMADSAPVQGGQCNEGWLRLEPVGFVCARHLSASLDNPQGKAREPAIDDILPYRYAHNTAHGTPLYRVVPSRDEMAQYEPYLKIERSKRDEAQGEPKKTASAETGKKKKKKRRKQADDSQQAAEATPAASASATAVASAAPAAPAPAASATTVAVASATPSPASTPTAAPDADAGAPVADLDAGADAAPDDSTKPWWMRTYEAGKNPEVRLSDMEEGSDKVLARRMARGFYVAVDHTFFANGRGWHKTTSSYVTPADRFAMVKPNEFHGQEIDEAHASNAVAFVISKQITTYTYENEKMTPKGGLKRYDRAFLTGKTATSGNKTFRETVDGVWLREGDIAFTEPGKRPTGVGEQERWVDVNLARQTLVAFDGDRPVYATLISSGRKGHDKAHDHQTPRGMWRVREKHIAATMDGDGAAAGDMPYSIEDVPYVMYFHESYALHGAFWHDNFGRQQSHGCVNLAPLDAKRLFFFTQPIPPKGWYGLYSSPDMQGSMVVVHD